MSKLAKPTTRRVVAAVFDLKHVDGSIFITGTQHGAPARLSRAEVLALVRFAAELWPDQVAPIVKVAVQATTKASDFDGDICVACERPLGEHGIADARACIAKIDGGAA